MSDLENLTGFSFLFLEIVNSSVLHFLTIWKISKLENADSLSYDVPFLK